MHIHIHVHQEPDAGTTVLLTQILKEIKKMPSIEEVKAAVQTAVDTAKQQIIDNVNAAVAKETADVIAQIKAQPQSTAIAQADSDAFVALVAGIPGAVKTSLAGSIDSISTGDGLPDASLPPPPPPPPPPAG